MSNTVTTNDLVNGSVTLEKLGSNVIDAINTKLPLGTIIMSTRLDTPFGFLPLDGGIYTQTQFPDFYDLLVGQNFGTKFKTVVLSAWTTEFNSNSGYCGYYGLDTISTSSFRLPALNDAFLRSGTAITVGTYGEDQIVNITGDFFPDCALVSPGTSGAFKSTPLTTNHHTNSPTTANSTKISIDASRVVNTGTQVQPRNISYRAFVQVYHSSEDFSVEVKMNPDYSNATYQPMKVDYSNATSQKMNADFTNASYSSPTASGTPMMKDFTNATYPTLSTTPMLRNFSNASYTPMQPDFGNATYPVATTTPMKKDFSNAIYTTSASTPMKKDYSNADYAPMRTTYIGASYQPAKIDLTNVPAGSVTADILGDLSVKEAKIFNGAVSNGKILNGAVTSPKIGAGQVKEVNIDNGAVVQAKIGTSAVTTDKIANGHVTSDKLATITSTTRTAADGRTGEVYYGIDVVIEWWRSTDGLSWYRRYKSGWIEQGGSVTTTVGHHTTTVVALPVPYLSSCRFTSVVQDWNSPDIYTITSNKTSNTLPITTITIRDMSNGGHGCNWFSCGY